VWPWIEEPDAEDVLVAKARAFAKSPPRDTSSEINRDPIDPRTAPMVAQRLCALEMPLPPGYNSAAHVGWLGQDMGQTTTVQDARSVLHANAYRDWLWFGTHHALGAAQREAFAAVVGRHARADRPLPLLDILDAVAHGRPTDEHQAVACRNFRDLNGRPGPAPTAELWADRLAEGRRTGKVTATGTIAWGSRGL
jgi:hypothetical protein